MLSSPSQLSRYAVLGLTVVAICYAFLAGLHTISDFDTGWQLATGRYVVQHHVIPSTDVFSYTATGRPWIYQPFGGVLLYGIYALAGYAGLSWLCALVCSATVALALFRRTPERALLAMVAVPLIADRIAPRAELFTTVIFAAFLSELWKFRCALSVRLWTLPLLMFFWVNFHPGFVVGIVLIAAYLLMDVVECLSADGDAARRRLRRAWPWLALTASVTLINPWGPGIYSALVQQNRAMELFRGFIGEWSATPLSWRNLGQAFSLHNPLGNYWWLFFAAVAAIVFALVRRQVGTALLLAGFAWASVRHLRFQGLFAIAVVVIGGTVFEELFALWRDRAGERHSADSAAMKPPKPLVVMAVAAVIVLSVTLWRIADLASNRAYVIAGSTAQFGTGESWWFPQRAAAFIERERLPANIFHDFALGGFVSFQLGLRYPDYVDGRILPFGPALFAQQQALLAEEPDSQAWQLETNRRNINILLVSVARFGGVGKFDLPAYCRSTTWQPVYLDEVSAVFLRNRPENQPLQRLRIDCLTQKFSPPASTAAADLFNFHSNAGTVLAVLGRNQEALHELARAESIFPFDPTIYLIRAQLLQAQGDLAGAERDFKAALARKETGVAWYALGRLLASQRRYSEAVSAIEASIKLTDRPFNNYKALGQVELLLHRPERALTAFAQAEQASPFHAESESLGNEFYAQIAQGQAEAWRQLGRLKLAEQFQQTAVQRTPQDAGRWLKLADIYQAEGQLQLAQEARKHADSVGSAAQQ